MCLLNGVPAKVQASHLVAHQWLVLDSPFGGSGLSNLEPPDHGIALVAHQLRQLFFCDGGE